MRICILGAGGLGSVLGGWLAATGTDVTLIGREPHVEAIQKNGLEISGIRGKKLVTEITAVTDPAEIEGEFDFLILAVKARATASALAGAMGLRDRVAAVLSFQNTVCKEDDLAAWVERDRIVGASTIEGGILVAPGVVSHTATAPTTAYFGELDGTTSDRVADLVAAFSAAGFSSRAVPDIEHVEWEKLLQISVVAGWSASTFGALGGSVAQGLLVRESAEQYVALSRELLSVYRAKGYMPQDFYAPFSRFRELDAWTFDEAVEEMMVLGDTMAAGGLFGRPSLHEDLLNGRLTEVDYSLGRWLQEAEVHRIEIPTARAIYRIVKGLESWLTALGGATPVSLVDVGVVRHAE